MDGKSVEVLIGIVYDEVKNVGVMNEGVMIVGIEIRGENEVEVWIGEVEMKIEDVVEVVIEIESGDEVLIVINFEGEVIEIRKKIERRIGYVVDKRFCKIVKIVLVCCFLCLF